MQRKIFCFWTGENDIPKTRRESIESFKVSGLELCLVTNDNLHEYIHTDDLHPAYYSLNLAHRADYLRAYFLHHFGGAYCDIKKIEHSWLDVFEELESDDNLLAAGYPEVGGRGVGNCYRNSILLNENGLKKINSYFKWRFLQLNYTRLIGNGAFIFKPNTIITQAWWSEVNKRLDTLSGKLLISPAKSPKERMGSIYEGSVSEYPVPWSYLLGDVLAPIILKNTNKVLKTLPSPELKYY